MGLNPLNTGSAMLGMPAMLFPAGPSAAINFSAAMVTVHAQPLPPFPHSFQAISKLAPGTYNIDSLIRPSSAKPVASCFNRLA